MRPTCLTLPCLRLIWASLIALSLGGCLSDADTANNRSVLSPAHSDKGDRSSDEPRQLCESTVEAGEPKTICY